MPYFKGRQLVEFHRALGEVRLVDPHLREEELSCVYLLEAHRLHNFEDL